MWSIEIKLDFFIVSYEQAIQKVKMLRGAPVIYNQRRLKEQPIPVVPTTNQVESNAQCEMTSRHSIPNSKLRRSNGLNDTVETDNSNQSSAIPQTNERQVDLPNQATTDFSDKMPHNSSNSVLGEDGPVVRNSEAEGETNQIVLTTPHMDVVSTESLLEIDHHESSQTSEQEMAVESNSEPIVSKNQCEMNPILAIATALAKAVSLDTNNAFQQAFDKSKSVESDSQIMILTNSDESNAIVLTNAECLAQSDINKMPNSRISHHIDTADTDPLNAPGCSHWTDSDVIRQSQINASQLEQSDMEMAEVLVDVNQDRQNTDAADSLSMDIHDDVDVKVETVPLHETLTENSNEIALMLEADLIESDDDSDDDNAGVIMYEDLLFFPKPMKATQSNVIKRENDIVSGNIAFNETVSKLGN